MVRAKRVCIKPVNECRAGGHNLAARTTGGMRVFKSDFVNKKRVCRWYERAFVAITKSISEGREIRVILSAYTDLK